MIDGGGPRARRPGTSRRYDFYFPQRAAIHGWADWQPNFWDYIFLGFSGSTQFGLSDTAAIQHTHLTVRAGVGWIVSPRAKFLLMLQVTWSVAVIVFIASIATGLVR